MCEEGVCKILIGGPIPFSVMKDGILPFVFDLWFYNDVKPDLSNVATIEALMEVIATVFPSDPKYGNPELSITQEKLICIKDDEAHYARLEDLENVLNENKIAYIGWTSGTYENNYTSEYFGINMDGVLFERDCMAGSDDIGIPLENLIERFGNDMFPMRSYAVEDFYRWLKSQRLPVLKPFRIVAN